jgi:hypothetical protein
MSEALIIVNLAISSIHLIMTACLTAQFSLKCCGKDCFDIAYQEKPNTTTAVAGSHH